MTFSLVYLCESTCPAALGSTSLFERDISRIAGNFSLPLTMSGMSFEGVAHTDGRYGSVTFSVFVTTHLQQKIKCHLL